MGSLLSVYAGSLYYGSTGSVVYRLDPTTGRQEMKYEAPVSSSWRSKGAPDFFVADGKVFAIANGIAVYDADDGELFWEYSDYTTSLTLGNASASALESDYVFMRYNSRVSPNNGSYLWHVKGWHSEPVVITQNQVIFWNYDSNSSTGGQTVLCVNASCGETLWSFDVGAPVFQPTEYNDFLLFGTYDGDFYALHAQNGTVAWKTSVDPQNTMHREMLTAVSPVIVDSETQSVLWSYVCNQLDLNVAGGQVQYVGVICNLDLNTGDLTYTNQFQGNGTITKETIPTPLLGLASLNDAIYLTAGYDLWILDQSTGNALDTLHFEHYLRPPIAYRTRVYVAADLFLFAYE
jgi:outer membrane protein assembly factor BamB